MDVNVSAWQQIGTVAGAPNVFFSVYDQNGKIYGSMGINHSGQVFAQDQNTPNQLVNAGTTATNGFHALNLELNFTNQTMTLFKDGLSIGSIAFNTSASNKLGSLAIVAQNSTPIDATLLVTNLSVTAGTVPTPPSCQLVMSNAGPCLPGGVAGTPGVGTPYILNTYLYVVGQPLAPFRVQFVMANATNYFSFTNGPGNWHVLSRTFLLNTNSLFAENLPMSLDDPIPWSVTVDPDGVSGNINPASNTASGIFTPTPPATPVELYSPRWMHGYETYSLSFQPGSGTLSHLWVVGGVPSVHGAQTAVLDTPPTNGLITNVPPYGIPVWQVSRTNVPASTFQDTNYFSVQLNKMRVNPTMLRTNTWADMAAMSTNWTQWLAPDAMCQATNPLITNFVFQSLPANYRSVLTPYDTARMLHLAVQRALVYQDPTTNLDAVTSLQNATGDCGSYGHLLVAALRCAGIPARSLSGFWQKGAAQKDWHVRAEFHLPNTDWIMADACLASLADQTGTYAYFFGDVMNSDNYLAVDVGDTAILPYHSFTDLLEAPNYALTGAATYVSYTPDSYLQPNGVLTLTNVNKSSLQLSLTDVPAQGTVTLQSSSDLITWTTVASNTAAGTNLMFSYPVSGSGNQLYRANVSP